VTPSGDEPGQQGPGVKVPLRRFATLTPSAWAIVRAHGCKPSRYGGLMAGRLAIRCAKVRRPKPPAGHSERWQLNSNELCGADVAILRPLEKTCVNVSDPVNQGALSVKASYDYPVSSADWGLGPRPQLLVYAT
jgi:hypothetical protein